MFGVRYCGNLRGISQVVTWTGVANFTIEYKIGSGNSYKGSRGMFSNVLGKQTLIILYQHFCFSVLLFGRKIKGLIYLEDASNLKYEFCMTILTRKF